VTYGQKECRNIAGFDDEAGDILFKRKQSLLFFIREGLKNGIVS
jgi:hypothetical protein